MRYMSGEARIFIDYPDIKAEAVRKGVFYQHEIARLIRVSETTLISRVRKGLTNDQQQEILSALKIKTLPIATKFEPSLHWNRFDRFVPEEESQLFVSVFYRVMEPRNSKKTKDVIVCNDYAVFDCYYGEDDGVFGYHLDLIGDDYHPVTYQLPFYAYEETDTIVIDPAKREAEFFYDDGTYLMLQLIAFEYNYNVDRSTIDPCTHEIEMVSA